MDMSVVKDTAKTYGFLWEQSPQGGRIDKNHFDEMQKVIPEKIAYGERGIEIGCGAGIDAMVMARDNPSVGIVAMDLSEGVYTARRITKGLKNVRIVRASSLDLPFRKESFDFCYSFGVIHHTPDPLRCFKEICRGLKEGGRVYLYLYEDHGGNIWKKFPLKMVSIARRATSKMNKRLLYILCTLMSPVIFLIFTIPSKMLKIFNKTRALADQMPFNFGTTPFSLRWDLYDRFGAPIELRFNEEITCKMLGEAGFCDIKFTRLNMTAGLVVWAKKGLAVRKGGGRI